MTQNFKNKFANEHGESIFKTQSIKTIKMSSDTGRSMPERPECISHFGVVL